MSTARLRSVTIERFKSHLGPTTVDFGALTVLIGRNNSGKSSVLQALLLLKQTLAFPRSDVPLHLKGTVESLGIRELTHGWPEPNEGETLGPTFAVMWSSEIDLTSFKSDQVDESNANGMTPPKSERFFTTCKLTLNYSDLNAKVILKSIMLESFDRENLTDPTKIFTFERQSDGGYSCKYDGSVAKKIVVELDHFIPYVSINRRNIGPRDRQRGWVNTFSQYYLQPLEDLKILLSRFEYLSSTRTLPPALYSHSSISPDSIGISGEQAAELLQANRNNMVHYLPPSAASLNQLQVPVKQVLQEAVNTVLAEMGIDIPLSIHDIPDVGFRLLFGRASLQHVGRGLTYLLPIVELGLISDPKRFADMDFATREEYEKCGSAICAFEEPEAHLHPKVQSRLAEWFIALGQAQRQVVVETHSDHLVRRLRSLVASTALESQLERWLIDNISIVNVEQNNGISSVRITKLTREGNIEDWPSDFFDETTEQENKIYAAALKKEYAPELEEKIEFVHSTEFEPDENNT